MSEKVEHLVGSGINGTEDDQDYEFKTWEEAGAVCHLVGIVQFWWYGYTDEDTWHDPPRPSSALVEWMNEHDSGITDNGWGPVMFRFASAEDAEHFRVSWHEPGVVQAKHYRAWCRRPRTETPRRSASHEEMRAAMERAKDARAEYIAGKVAR